jgi:HAD superfamily hydrolase (TIGR01509 family)
MIEAILFDLDGLMVDSEPHSFASWRAVLDHRGIDYDYATFELTLGLSLSDTVDLFGERYQLTGQAAELIRDKTEYQLTHLDGNVQPMPGLIALLDAIDQRGLKKAVASSGRRCYVSAVLSAIHLDGRFATIVSGDDVVNSKPAPDIFLAAAQALDVDPAHCLVLEDAPAGVQAARTAGMMCFAVPNDYTRRLDLSLADRVVSSLYEVKSILTSNA